MPLFVVTPFRINLFRTLVVVWRKRLSLRYWCRECGRKEIVEIFFGQTYPQFLCPGCHTKNVINIKYK